MKKLSWVAAGIACVLAAGAWVRAVDRIHEDRRVAVEEALRTSSTLAYAYEQGVIARLDTLRAAGREDEVARVIAAAKHAPARLGAGAGHVAAMVSAEERGNLRRDGYLYTFREVARYPLVVAVGVAESTVLAAAERRRGDHYVVAVLESILAALASVTVTRFAWRTVSRERGIAGKLGPGPVPQ